jgi:hypothetical protein
VTIPAPEFEWIEEVSTSLFANDRSRGAVMRGKVREGTVRRFHLHWNTATQTQKDQMEAEWVATKGAAGTTTYTTAPIADDSVTVRIIEFSASMHLWRMDATLEEEFTPY